MKITNDIIESYFDCKLKSYLKRQGEQGEIRQIENHYRVKLQHYRKQVFQKKFTAPFTDESTQIQSLSAFKNIETLYNVRISSKRFDLFCDSGYDSLNCDQQKCLIHFIRDMNADLVRNPFNEEFKTMSKAFTVLLKRIVETIDQYGLKRYFLKKYMREVSGFLSTIEGSIFRTEIAIKYQIRFLKNRNKLFEFINHDNVSWNNNNAEHAIKILAMHANKDLNGFRETRIHDYLKIMSIYQSCKFQNLSFLKYLLSTETTLDAYVAKNRRHTNLN